MVENDTHSFVPLIRSTSASNSSTPSLSSLAGRPVPATCDVADDVHPSEHVDSLSRPIAEVSKIVKRVRDHVCGRASFGDMRTLIQQNCLWDADVEKIL